MQLDNPSYYALSATVCIAQRSVGRPVPGRIVARLCDIPTEYLLKILQRLIHSGILCSERGRAGGFLLARSPDQTSLLAIIEAIQGPVRTRAPGPRRARPTRAERLIDRLCIDIAEYARDRFAHTTVADLMGDGLKTTRAKHR